MNDCGCVSRCIFPETDIDRSRCCIADVESDNDWLEELVREADVLFSEKGRLTHPDVWDDLVRIWRDHVRAALGGKP